MTLVKYRTSRPTMLNTFFDDVFSKDLFMREQDSVSPAANVKETPSGYEIQLAVPGFNKSDIQIELKGQTLLLSGKKEEKTEEEDHKFTFREFSAISFSRSFTLPKNIRKESIDATYEQGILTVVLPRETPKEPEFKKIDIR
ncbi:MAG: hypothetical protein RL226_575 [Bacteroidota bacterium]